MNCIMNLSYFLFRRIVGMFGEVKMNRWHF